MARNEADREDLFEELRSAVMRWELLITGTEQTIVAGVRSGGRFSIYFTPDCCYHFDEESRLKRAFVDGFLYRTQGTTLARLQRERTETETTLFRWDLTEQELAEFLLQMQVVFRRLEDALARDAVSLRRVEGGGESPLQSLRLSLEACVAADGGLAPAFPTRRR